MIMSDDEFYANLLKGVHGMTIDPSVIRRMTLFELVRRPYFVLFCLRGGDNINVTPSGCRWMRAYEEKLNDAR